MASAEAAGEVLSVALLPGFSLLALAGVTAALRAVNAAAAEAPPFRAQLLSLDGAAVRAADGVAVTVEQRLAAPSTDRWLLFCAGPQVVAAERPAWLAAVRAAARPGRLIGACGGACELLVEAGVVAPPRPDPAARAPPRYQLSDDRLLARTDTAVLAAVLAWLRERRGVAPALAAAQGLGLDGIPAAEPATASERLAERRLTHPVLRDAIELMQANIEQPLLMSELSALVGVSKRQLERLFRRYLEVAPSRYYLVQRLQRARQMLLQTNLPVIDVAMACGFASAGHFSQTFKAVFGESPREARAPTRPSW